MLNKQKGNMYPFVTHTWNPIKGKCPHDCSYCYMKVYKNLGELRLDEKALKDDLGSDNFIFVGSSNDLFQEDIPDEWISRTLGHCRLFPNNKYLFQTKNPSRMLEFRDDFPPTENCIWGTTIETNRHICNISKAPPPLDRTNLKFFPNRMCTIEPIMDFDLGELVLIIKDINPKWVNIGADSKNHNLPEPSKEKVESLITELKKFTEVKIKDNLKRLIR